MNRKVYLIGEIEKKFGSVFSMNADSFRDIFRCIDCNRPGFREYLAASEEKGIVFTINYAGKELGEEELLTPLKEGDVTIAAVPVGSKSDSMKVVTGVVLMYVSFMMGNVDGVMRGIQMALMGMGVTLASQGIQGMLAPDPATEAEQEDGYLYTGPDSIVVEGAPIPVLYGELRVPGQPISIGLNNSNVQGSGSGYGSRDVTTSTPGDMGLVTGSFNVYEDDTFRKF